MPDTKTELCALLNAALELEHAAYLQYLSHAEILVGFESPGIIEQLKDNAADEAAHAETLRNLIGNFLDFSPSAKAAETHAALDTRGIIKTNIADEKTAIKHYVKTLDYIHTNESKIEAYHKFEREVRLILIGEQEHVAELQVLNG